MAAKRTKSTTTADDLEDDDATRTLPLLPEEAVLITDRDHPLYDERVLLPLDEEMVQSILLLGVIEPIVVRRNGKVGGKWVYEVVVGRQRVKSAREANRRIREENRKTAGKRALIRVNAIVRRGSDADMCLLNNAENSHRQDDPPMVRARKAQHAIDRGASRKSVCISCGFSTARSLDNILALLDLHSDVQAAVDAERLAPHFAVRAFATIPRERQPGILAKVLPDGKIAGPTFLAKVKAAIEGRDASAVTAERRAMPGAELRRVLTTIDAETGPELRAFKAGLRFAVRDEHAFDGHEALREQLERAGALRTRG